MPDFYYQIKGRKSDESEGDSAWSWPPVFSGLVTAPGRKEAKVLIEDEYGRQFPLRVLRKDIHEHAYLLHIRVVEPHDDYLLRRFRETACKECGAVFKLIDKYNDTYADHRGPDHCSAKCASDGKFREVQEFRLVAEGKLPAVIYQVRQKSTGKVYVGQTIQPFTLRWWQHLTNPSDCKFHEAMKATPITDWEFSVLEVIVVPVDCASKTAYITDRERHWIEAFNSVTQGYNTMRPTGISPQQSLALVTAVD